ncbi:UNVERIFIED_CONTAM: hypothetical protein RMT77_001744 [Armadillidium vulgare]
MANRIRQNYHEDCEAFINKVVNLELIASYTYLSMSFNFNRDGVSLPGMEHLCKELSEEKHKDAEYFMKIQNKRGGRTVLQAIESPFIQTWETALKGLQDILSLEKRLNQALLDLHEVASDKKDPHLTDFLEGKYLDKQVEVINKIGHIISRVKRAGPTGLGEYVLDRNIST